MPPGRLETAAAVQVLRGGGVLVLATDTVPGLHCRADDAAAVGRIFACKGRVAGKSVLVLAGSLEQALRMTGPLTADQLAACRACWPGPFSLILPAVSGLAPEVTAGGQTLAIRVPGRDDLRELILAVGVPLVSTSANRAGSAPLTDLGTAGSEFGREIDGVWGTPPVLASAAIPSALVDLTTTPFALLRKGPLPWPPAGGPHLDAGSRPV